MVGDSIGIGDLVDVAVSNSNGNLVKSGSLNFVVVSDVPKDFCFVAVALVCVLDSAEKAFGLRNEPLGWIGSKRTGLFKGVELARAAVGSAAAEDLGDGLLVRVGQTELQGANLKASRVRG